MELERILLEKSDVQEVLMKMEAMCSNHEQDKQRLQEELKRVTSNIITSITSMLDINYRFIVDGRREK